MPKRNSIAAHRAWRLLKIAIFWARKGGILKRRLMLELRGFPKYIKTIGHGHAGYRDQIHYGERELSFDKTPIFHAKMHRPASMRFLIPCITPHDIDFDYDFEDDEDDSSYNGGVRYDHYDGYGYGRNDEDFDNEKVKPEEEGIDGRAEEFIAKFYAQIKLQRQISFLRYRESVVDTEEY